VADGGENGVGCIAGSSLEITAAEMALGLHMADHGFDGGAASQLALDGTEYAALLARDEDMVRVRRIMAAVSLVDIGALNLAPGEPLGVLDGRAQRVPVIRMPGNVLVCSTNWPPGARVLVVTIEALTPNS